MVTTKTYGSVPRSSVQATDFDSWGNKDDFKLLFKSWSQKESWLKSTKALQIDGVGCVVQVSTQNEELISEACTFVPSVRIEEEKDSEGIVTSRKLVKI